MSKFKVGDPVRVVRQQHPGIPVGFETEVAFVLPGYVHAAGPDGLDYAFRDDQIELIPPTLESRVSALEAAVFVAAIPPSRVEPKPVGELRREDVEFESLFGKGLWVASTYPSEDAQWWAANTNYTSFRRIDTTPPQPIAKDDFVQALRNSERDEQPTPQPEVVPWEAVEVRARVVADSPWLRRVVPASEAAKGTGGHCCDIRDSRTGRVMLYDEFVASARAAAEAKPLTLADVEISVPWYDAWLPCGRGWRVDGRDYTAEGYRFRRKDTFAPITEDEFLAICRRERDGGAS